MVSVSVVVHRAEPEPLHSLFNVLDSIVTLVNSLIPVVVIIVRLSLRMSSGTSTSVTVVHLLRSP